MKSSVLGIAVFLSFVISPSESAGSKFPDALVRLSPALSSETASPGQSVDLAVTAEIAPGWHINAHKPNREYLIPTILAVDAPGGISVEEVEYPAPVRKTISFEDTPLDLYEGRVVFKTKARTGEIPAGGYTLTARLRYQACDDEKCLPPEEVRIEIPIRVEQIRGIQEKDGDPHPRLPPQGGKGLVEELFREKGIALTLLLIFWGGVVLNLTPCVYPMIPVTVAYFGGRNATGVRPMLSAAAYYSGIIVTFGALGTIAGLTGGLFGALLQNPAVLAGLSILMIYLAAGMFGWAPFQLPDGLVQRVGSGRVPLGAFGMGATIGVVAAPCIGPFVVGLLVYVGSQKSAFIGFALFSVMAAGLGLPYLLLGLFSGRIRNLPRSGAWMDVVKWIFGFVLLGMAVYFISPLISDSAESKLYGAILSAGAITSAIVSFRKNKLAAAAGLILAAALLTAAYRLAAPMATPLDESFWLPYDRVSYESARASGRPLILDFSAEWCAPCKQLDRLTFSDARVQNALAGWVRLKVDLTLYDTPESLSARREYRVTGVPTTVLIDDAGSERFRFEGFFTAEEFLQEYSKLESR